MAARPHRVKRQEVAAFVRDRILAGDYAPGERLPSREAMAKLLSAGYVTVQKGLTRLGDEGFVVSRHGDGTYVAEHLPHRCHYGMLVVRSQEEVYRQGQARFHHTMLLEAQRFNQQQRAGRVIPWFDPFDQPERPGYHQLVQALAERRLAGLIFLDAPHTNYLATPLLQAPFIGRVTTGLGEAGKGIPGLQCITLSDDAFLTRAMALACARNRRRVAVLTTNAVFAKGPAEYRHLVATTASRHGLVTKPHWTIPVHPHMREGIATTVRLLLDLPRNEWPDALIVTDDHMVEAAVMGLYEAGVDTNRDLTVVGYCNFPDRPPTVLPVVRLGMDCRGLLARMIGAIGRQLAGQAPGQVEWVEPVTEAEFAQRHGGCPAGHDTHEAPKA